MNTEPYDLLEQALALSDNDRASLAASLLRSLDTEIDPNADKLWDEEIKRRLDEIKSGEVELVSWDEMLSKMKRRANG
ncbi:addiction module protein [Mariniblastus sp.]|nr:addiction module protein [Mariniblastus sp.]